MIEVTLHPAPRWRDVVLQQIRIVALKLRPEALVVALVIGAGTIIIVCELLTGGPGYDSRETFPTPLIAFLIPFAVWRGENRFGPAFLWTLAVDRQRLALARVFAGLVWLMSALTLFVCWLFTCGLVAKAPLEHTILRVPVTATIGTYLIGSALVLGLRHPLRWLLGTAGGLMLLMRITELFGRTSSGEWRIFAGSPVTRPAVYGPYGLRTILSSSGFFSAVERVCAAFFALPPFTQWAISAVFWLGAGAVSLWLASSRHRETRRT